MYKVLIVEDEMLVRLGLKNSIDWNKHGMVVAGDVANGRAALDFFHEHKPDIIITDIKMPVMDGMELISRIRETDDTTRIIILTCLEEFDLIKKAMSLGVSDYILKLTMTEEEIGAILDKIRHEADERKKLKEKDVSGVSNRDVVKDRLLKDYIFYSLYSCKEFASRIQSLGLCLKPGHMVLAIIEIDHYERLKAHFEDSKGYLTNFALMNAINEILARYAKGEVFHEDGPRYILILNFDGPAEEDAIYSETTHILEKIGESLKIYFNTAVSFGVSSLCNWFEALKAMYLEAADVLSLKFFHGSGIFIRKDKTDYRAVAREKFETLYKLYNVLGIQDDSFHSEFDKKVRSMANAMPLKKEPIKDMLHQFLYWITDNMHLSGEESYELVISYGTTLKSVETLDEAMECIKDFIFVVRNSLKAKNIMSDEIAKALKYMQQKYAQELSLLEVAGYIGLSASYFSSLFKKELHMNFIEYLNEIRIEKAKELLRDTCLKSYEIAEKVGFKESTYFSMMFKKITGSSPYKFRQVWQKAWKDDADGEND